MHCWCLTVGISCAGRAVCYKVCALLEKKGILDWLGACGAADTPWGVCCCGCLSIVVCLCIAGGKQEVWI